MTAASADPRVLIDRLVDALNRNDYAALGAILADDCVVEYPQSGEVIRGRKNNVAVIENYPGRSEVGPSPEVASVQVLGGDQWVLTPAFALIRLEGSGNARTAILKVRYPDGSTWWNVNFVEFRGAEIARWVSYFAPMFEPPAWRAAWVEPPR